MNWDSFNNDISLIEVGPRDGLQNEKVILSLEDKAQFIQLLADAGFLTIEATSFVRADKIPQMADAQGLYQKVSNLRISLPCLVPNLKGLNMAIKSGVRDIAVFTATSESFNRKNINSSIDESLINIKEVTELAKTKNIKIRGYISTAFGCPYEGKTDIKELVKIARSLIDMGVYEVSIGDTIGIAHPRQVEEVIHVLKQEFSLDQLAMHFHDTRAMAVANTLVSLEQGIFKFDSSAAGLGGCPYANGATGNVATEDLIYLFHSLGLKTGIDLDKLVEASRFILSKLNKISGSKYLNSLL